MSPDPVRASTLSNRSRSLASNAKLGQPSANKPVAPGCHYHGKQLKPRIEQEYKDRPKQPSEKRSNTQDQFYMGINVNNQNDTLSRQQKSSHSYGRVGVAGMQHAQ